MIDIQKELIHEMMDLLNERILHHTGSKMVVYLASGGNHPDYLRACKEQANNPQAVITCSCEEKDLYRVPSWDIEFSIRHEDGKYGVTGNYDKIKMFMSE